MVTEKSVLCHTQKQREPNRLPGAQRREGCAFTYAAELQSVGTVFNEASSGRDKDDRYLGVENYYRADTAGLFSKVNCFLQVKLNSQFLNICHSAVNLSGAWAVAQNAALLSPRKVSLPASAPKQQSPSLA